MSKRVLIVSPHFPPVNAPDMQRVRVSLPYFEAFGWTPHVLAVAPTEGEALDPLLVKSIPAGVPIERVAAVPLSVTRKIGVGNLALRALPALYAAGHRLLAAGGFDLVYFSTTMFMAMPLGRVWKRRFGIPYVLDIQDPWLSDYYETHPESEPPPKYQLAKRVHARLEPWTMKEADGIIAVSSGYIDTIRRRYPWMRRVPACVLPFGAAKADFDLIAEHPQDNRHFTRGDGRTHGVYVGRGGGDMATALGILFEAVRLGLSSSPDLFASMQLHFIGTSYATDARARTTVEPLAARAGVGTSVHEETSRVPYFEALQLLEDADFLLVPGSDDPAYTASKIYPYVLARKPIVAVVHERSPLVELLREIRAGLVVTFPSSPGANEKMAAAGQLVPLLRDVLAAPRQPDTDWDRFERYTAREMTRRQCEVFDAVLEARTAAVA